MGVPAKDTRFLRKLYLILTTEDADIVSWSADGRAFTIHDTAIFQRMIKTKHHLSSLCTFRQNLHAHGFTEIEYESSSSSSSLQANEVRDEKMNVTTETDVKTAIVTSGAPETYFHPFFERGHPEHLEKISFDPSVKFRCQECKRQPNDLGTKCSFRRNTFKAKKPEAAYAMMAGTCTGAVSATAGRVVKDENAVGRSLLMVQLGARRPHQNESSDAEERKPGRKLKHPPSIQLNMSSAGGAFLRPSSSSLSSERAGKAGYNAQNTNGSSTSASMNDQTKPTPGSLMVRLSLGRKDEIRKDEASPSTGVAMADNGKGIKLSVTLSSRATTSSGGSSPGQLSLSKAAVSQKASPSTTASNPKSMMSLKRISPSLSEQDDASDDESYEPAADDSGYGRSPESNHVKRAVFTTATSYSHLKMAPAPAQNLPFPFRNNSTTESIRTKHQVATATSSQDSSSTRDDSERGSVHSILADSKSVPYQPAPHWSRHNIVALEPKIRRDQEQSVVDTGLSRGATQREKPARRLDHASDFGLTDTSSSVSRDYQDDRMDSREDSLQRRNHSFDPTRREHPEREQHEQPASRRDVAKSAEPAMVVIPTRQSSASSLVPSLLSSSSGAAKRPMTFSLMPSLKPPMNVTLSIKGGGKPTGDSCSQSEQGSSQQRKWMKSTVVSTISRGESGADAPTSHTAMGKALSWGKTANTGSASNVDSHRFPVIRIHTRTPQSTHPDQTLEKQPGALPQKLSVHSSDNSAERKSGDVEMIAKNVHRSNKRPRAGPSSSSGATTKKLRAQAARGNSSRTKLTAKAKNADGSTDQSGLSLLVLASSEQT